MIRRRRHHQKVYVQQEVHRNQIVMVLQALDSDAYDDLLHYRLYIE
jgi:hypothetical protein